MSPIQLMNLAEVTVPESVTNRNSMVSATHNLSIYSRKEIEYLKKTHEQNNVTLLKQHWRKGEVFLREVFLRVLRFSPLLKKTNTFKFQFDLERTDTFQRVLMNSLVLRG